MYYYYDPSVLILIPAIIFTMFAQAKVKGNFNRYAKVRNMRNMTGAQAARRVLDANGLYDVTIQQISGSLTDHYDPSKKVVRLSQTVYDVNSISAISVACHEVGHAIQHAEGYLPLNLRSAIVPVVNFASKLSWPLIFIGILLLGNGSYMGDTLFTVGVVLFVAVIIFHAVTLPVEFNASSRALKQMDALGIVTDEERSGARKVLSAAAMTYVAALATAIANLLRIIALRNNRD